MTSPIGSMKFAEIPKLPDNWWESTPKDDPSVVWDVWDRNTYYLWGANRGNTMLYGAGYMIGGGGMAGVSHGPTIGRSHPHYVGVITMDIKDAPVNDAIFLGLQKLLLGGYNVVVPTYHDRNLEKDTFIYKYSLGTGIGASVQHWREIQLSLFEQIRSLLELGGPLDMPSGTYWPDLSVDKHNPPRMKLESLSDLKVIIKYLKAEITNKAGGIPSR